MHRYHNYTVIWIYPDSSVLWDFTATFFCQATGSNLCGSVSWSPLWCPWQGTQDLHIQKTYLKLFSTKQTTSTRLFPRKKRFKQNFTMFCPLQNVCHLTEAPMPWSRSFRSWDLRSRRARWLMVDVWRSRFCKNVWCGMIPQLSNYVWKINLIDSKLIIWWVMLLMMDNGCGGGDEQLTTGASCPCYDRPCWRANSKRWMRMVLQMRTDLAAVLRDDSNSECLSFS